MRSPPRPRSEVLATMPDVRRHPGTRHPLAAILALVWSALLCGYRSYPALAAWRGTSGTRLTPALGVPPPAALCSHPPHGLARGGARGVGSQARGLGRGAAASNARVPGRRSRTRHTSLAPERADAARVLALVRGHWPIENPSPGGRDVTFDEDRSQVRCGNLLQGRAALRNTVIGLTRGAGETNVAAAYRRFAAPPALALGLLGIQLEN